MVIVLPTANVPHELFNGEKLVTVGTSTQDMLADQPAPVIKKSAFPSLAKARRKSSFSSRERFTTLVTSINSALE